jgi:hypothetical protein
VTDASNLSPLDIIAAINAMQGRETGPSASGYVDEKGSPVRVQWAKDGGVAENVTEPIESLRDSAQRMSPAEFAAWMEGQEESGRLAEAVTAGGTAGGGGGGAPAASSAAAHVEEIDYIDLSTGQCRWGEYEIVLTVEQMAEVMRPVKECVRARLLAKIAALEGGQPEEVRGGEEVDSGAAEGSRGEDRGGGPPEASSKRRRTVATAGGAADDAPGHS